MFVIGDRVDDRRKSAALPVRFERRAEAARDLEVERADGSRAILAASTGRYQLVHFWATWCPPCRTELPSLLELARRRRERLDVWAVSVDQDWGAVRAFIGGHPPAQVVRDAGGAAAAYDVTGLPDSYLVGPDGRVRARFAGAQDWRSGEIERALDDLMRE